MRKVGGEGLCWHQCGYPEGGIAREEVSHEQASSWDYLMVESAQGKPGGDTWWEENRISHGCDTPGPTDQSGILLIDGGKPLPKGNGPWEPTQAIAESYGGVKPHSKRKGGLGKGFSPSIEK